MSMDKGWTIPPTTYLQQVSWLHTGSWDIVMVDTKVADLIQVIANF